MPKRADLATRLLSPSETKCSPEAQTTRPITDRVKYLNHAATGPISRGVQQAIHRQTEIRREPQERQRRLDVGAAGMGTGQRLLRLPEITAAQTDLTESRVGVADVSQISVRSRL